MTDLGGEQSTGTMTHIFALDTDKTETTFECAADFATNNHNWIIKLFCKKHEIKPEERWFYRVLRTEG